MIPAEIVFITMPATTDFTGPIIGIGGVLLGSLAAFLGIRYQLRQQRLYDIRRLAANLIAAGEELRDAYLAKKDARIDVPTMPAWLALMDAKSDEMFRLLRHLELLSSTNASDAAEAYVAASSPYGKYAHSLYGEGHKPNAELIASTYTDWNEARDAFTTILQSKRGKDVI
jgi:hypothetical protein